MSYSLLVHTKAVGNGGSGGTSPSIDTTGANLIVLCASGSQVFFTSAPTDNKSNTYIQVNSFDGSSTNRSRIYYAYNPTVGTGHTFTSPDAYSSMCIAAFSGAVSSPLDNFNSGEEGSGSVTVSTLSPTENNELIIVLLGNNNSNPSIDGGFTITDFVNVSGESYSSALAYLIQTTAASVGPLWTFTGVGNSLGATFKDTPAAGGATWPGYRSPFGWKRKKEKLVKRDSGLLVFPNCGELVTC